MKGGAHGSPGVPARSPVEELESGRGRGSAPVLLSVAWPAAVFQKRQRDVQLTTPVQVTIIMGKMLLPSGDLMQLTRVAVSFFVVCSF